jgi:iron complex outermembrane receptor protein
MFDLTLALRSIMTTSKKSCGFTSCRRSAEAFDSHSFRATFNQPFLHRNNSLFGYSRTTLDATHQVILQGRGAREGYTFNNFRQTQSVSFFVPTPPPFPQLFGLSLPLASYPVAPVYGLAAVSINRTLQGPEEDIPDALRGLSTQQRQGLVGLLGRVAQLTSPLQTTAAILGIPDNSALGYRRVDGPVDIEPLKQTTSNTFELGYKGIVNNRVLFAVDGYYVTKVLSASWWSRR